LLAKCWHSGQYECMSVQITIRDVPEKVRDELAARAALQGKSMQEYLSSELLRMASRPSIDAWLKQVRRRKRTTQSQVSSDQIIRIRDLDKR
jgi:antitoxin FitA